MNSEARSMGGVSWRRYAMVFTPGLVLAAVALGLVGEGALAASFAVSGTAFKLSAGTLDGTGFVSYGGIDSGANGQHHPVSVSGFKTAELTSLCQSVVSPSPLGPVSMKLTAGSGANPVKATDMVADFDNLQGDLTFTQYASGVDASQVSGGPSTGPAGGFGQQASTIHIDGLKQHAWATTAGTFVLKGLNIDVSFGTHECF